MPFDPNRHHRRSVRLAGYDYTRVGAYYVTICAATRGSIFGRGMRGSIALNPIGQIVQDTWMSLPDHYPHIALDAFVVMPDHVHGIIVFVDVPSTIHATIGNDGDDGGDADRGDRGGDRDRGGDGDGGDGGDNGGAQRAAPLHNPPSTSNPSRRVPIPSSPSTSNPSRRVPTPSSTPNPPSRLIPTIPVGSATTIPYVVRGSLGVIVRAFKSAATRVINCHRNTPGASVWQRNYYEHIVRNDADLERIRCYIENNPAKWRTRSSK